MKRLIPAIALSATVLAGCTMFVWPEPGISEQQLTELRGRPDYIYPLKNGNRLFEWPVSVNGQNAYMAVVSPDGKLISYEQVLTVERFGTIEIDKATKQDVLMTVGHPSETEYQPMTDHEIWSYRYKEQGVWNSMMHVYFDKGGIVRKLENGQDPMHLLGP